ncbi:2-keto-4-pentenoate hydratase/2-oxohepta-3-ene-1,7-dioic acid hydratase (catechol pathway) [Nakamurella panacisegetis]|uniref:2-keto-4-pentenoate hydratase/2-oxohepta-3-ene-1,7-dioic acid hydratase (Catechol pathway) n=1 Tax=Nakamurella panacisegetis TaxID=1090615 RepID=A0A1H0MAA8_9ACTN|nr:fumarylacetoacetate hydrolase family protein [Nakamurella panacisegetis]SDO77241.1 2-keto-4-pentenoate hydratase/2-oxohepta-3-ene-1,7-dioic acid hydratase (catechol pathway) [Nakamurella panacisegetis]
MKLLRVGPAGSEIPVVMDRTGATFDASGITTEFDGAFFAGGGLARLAAAAGRLPSIDITGRRLGAPIARPGAVLCIGMNYVAHAAETGSPPPAVPILFYKSPNTVVGPNDEVLIPRGSSKTDWEVELGVVIGSTARYLPSREAALECVAGYAVSNDVSERAFQLETSGGQWSKGKSCETFNPLGPYLVTPDELGDPQDLRLQSWVNGEPRQDSNTSDMIFDVAEIIYQLSQVLVLDPGDLVNTGTPQGVALSGRFPYLQRADVLELQIQGLGRQRQVIGQA